jgi:predicted lipoprotein
VDDPSEPRLQSAQQAWLTARGPWKRTELFKFGPVEEPPRFGPKIDFWPARPAEVDAVLNETSPLVPEDLGAAAKGLPALEYLLFADGAIEGFQQDERRREYTRVLAANLIVQARGLTNAWDPREGNYLAQLVDAGGESEMYDTLSMALSEVVNRMAFTVENIRADKLGAGIAPDGTPQPDKLESYISGRSVRDIEDNLRGIELLYFGDRKAGILALDDYLKHRGYQLGGRMKAALGQVLSALEQVDTPLSEAIVEAQDDVAAAIDELGKLQRLIQVDVIGALSLSVRFNDNDGD